MQKNKHIIKSSTSALLSARNYSTAFTWNEPHKGDLQSFEPEQVFKAGVRHHHRCNTAYPLNHRKTTAPYRVQRTRDQRDIKRVLHGAFDQHDKIMLYVHVPFCDTRCQFCEYTVIDPKVGKQADAQKIYFDVLLKEFEMYDQELNTSKKELVGFDIGGGTPSRASIQDIGRVMDAATKHFNLNTNNMEVSIETTPKIAAAEPDKIKAYYEMGIRRISMGLQTTDFKLARELGRDDANASADYIRKSVENIRNAGFKSFNIDLMYGFPVRKGAKDPWPETVADCIALQPDHITLYRMRYKGTLLEHLADRVGLAQVNQQEQAAREIISAAGYEGWIGKNTYSKNGSGCSDYLDKRVVKAVPYVGLGLGSQSFTHHSLSYNLGAVTKAADQYVASIKHNRIPIQDLYHLSQRAAMAKMISVSFYYGGIDLDAFFNCFGVQLNDVFAREIEFVLQLGIMVYDPVLNRLQLTTLGKKHFGGVVALFYSPSAQEYVVNLEGGENFKEDVVEAIVKQQKGGINLQHMPNNGGLSAQQFVGKTVGQALSL